MIIQNKAGKLICPYIMDGLTSYIFDLYEKFNQETFGRIWIDPQFKKFTELIYNAFKQDFNEVIVKSNNTFEFYDNNNLNSNRVVLGFSAGLDSVYQLIKLLEQGKEVICFHLKNINTYENGQATKQCLPIIEKLRKKFGEFKIFEVNASICKNMNKDNKFRQFWPENPMKNQLILSMMMDYAYEYNIKYVSLGDDLGLPIKDAVAGINLTDAREITLSFIEGTKEIYSNIKFVPITDRSDKLERLKTLDEYGLTDDFYSCVTSGRFNKLYHDRCEEKYGISLPSKSCGCYCRKCAMHCLLEHYGLIKNYGIPKYPDDFIDKCWERMWKNSHSADYELFKPELSLEQKIDNLFNY